MSSYRRYYLPRVSWSDVKGGVWRIQPYNVTDYFFIFRVQNLLTSAMPKLEAVRKQVDWVKMSKREEMPQPEAVRKQAGWVKMPKLEELLQLERKRKLTRPQGRCYTDNCDVNM